MLASINKGNFILLFFFIRRKVLSGAINLLFRFINEFFFGLLVLIAILSFRLTIFLSFYFFLLFDYFMKFRLLGFRLVFKHFKQLRIV